MYINLSRIQGRENPAPILTQIFIDNNIKNKKREKAVCITYNDYENFGHSIIPENDFARYSNMAEKTVRRFMKNKKAENFTEDNRRGICEIADILYAEHKQINRPIAGFSNENYKEQYFEGKRLSSGEQIWDVMQIYFTQEQLYRGV